MNTINTNTQETTKKSFFAKVDEFFKQVEATASKRCKIINVYIDKGISFLNHLTTAVLNFTVKLSIILIALIMAYEFVQDNPAVMQEGVEFFTGLWGDLCATCNKLVDTLLWWR